MLNEGQPEPLDARTIAKYFAVAIGILAVLALIPSGLKDEDAALDALGEAGFTKVQTTGHRLFGCGLSYSFFTGYEFSTGFQAQDKSGHLVSGTVCSGFGKSPHVSLDSKYTTP